MLALWTRINETKWTYEPELTLSPEGMSEIIKSENNLKWQE